MTSLLIDFVFRNVLSIDEYASCFDNIDPLAPYKKWPIQLVANQSSTFGETASRKNVYSQRVQAVFILSDPVDWSRDIQVSLNLLVTDHMKFFLL